MKANKISKDQLEKTALLARIGISPEEQKKYSQELSEVLDFFAEIQKLDTSRVKAFDHYQQSQNDLRKDEVIESQKDEKNLIKKNFPDRKGDFLKVKKVLKNS